jgi:hypothetical protein
MERVKRLQNLSSHLIRIAKYLEKSGTRSERLKKHLFELNEIDKNIKTSSFRSPDLLQHFYTQADIAISVVKGVLRDIQTGNLTLEEQAIIIQQDASLSKIIKKLYDYHKEFLNKKLFPHGITPNALRDKINELAGLKQNLRKYLRKGS